MPGLPTGTVTFLFTDIEGSTRLIQALGDRYADVLDDYRRLVRAAIQERGGQEVDTQGDAIFAAFPRARDALTAAVAMQRAINAHPWSDGALLRARMGLHTGEPLRAETEYVGMDVHRAARICSAGHGGQILVSQAVGVLATPDLPPGVSLRDLGTHRLKDLREPEHLFQAAHPDLPIDFPPLKSLDARPNNLPIQLTSFIGREREIAEVKRVLGATRLVTLTGSGGAGKTRLALQVAADVVDAYPDGVWLVEFAPLADPALVPKTVASALSVPEQPGRDITETLVDALRPKALLLLFDNCEHLLSACRDLAATLLRKCPHLRILATSRERLGVPGEALWRVPSLSVPEDVRHLPPPGELVLFDAVRLFVDRATATAPEFTVTSENGPAVAQVCQRLDGIPLAIELAAARVKVLAVEQIRDRLDDRFRLLTGGSRIALPRQQTLRAAIDWSYHLLTETERVLLRRVSVFAGGWTLEAAELVCAGGSVETESILDLLTSLVDKSLVLTEIQRGEARYRLLETVREYGLAQLRESREADDLRRRQRDWYVALVEQAYPELSRGRQTELWLERLETEGGNIRAVLEWNKMEKDGAEAGLRLAGTLLWYWYMHGDWREGRAWLEEVLTRSSEASPSVLPKVLQGATYLALRQGDYERTVTLADKGLAICRELGDKEVSPWFLLYLGLVAATQGDHERARVLYQEGLDLGHEMGNRFLNGVILANLGNVTGYQGDYERAAALTSESLAQFRAAESQWGMAFALRISGFVAFLQGDYRRAIGLLMESLNLARKVRDRGELCEQALEDLAKVAAATGHNERAARLFGAAEALREILGERPNPFRQAYHQQYVGVTHAGLGDAAFAANWAEGRAMTLEQAIEYAMADQTG